MQKKTRVSIKYAKIDSTAVTDFISSSFKISPISRKYLKEIAVKIQDMIPDISSIVQLKYEMYMRPMIKQTIALLSFSTILCLIMNAAMAPNNTPITEDTTRLVIKYTAIVTNTSVATYSSNMYFSNDLNITIATASSIAEDPYTIACKEGSTFKSAKTLNVDTGSVALTRAPKQRHSINDNGTIKFACPR